MMGARSAALLLVAAVALPLTVFAQGPAAPPAAHPAIQQKIDRAFNALVRGVVVESQALFLEAVAMARQAGDAALLSRALGGLAETRMELSDWAGALDYAQQAYDANRDPRGRPRISFLNRRGRIHQELREREAALRDYEEGLELARALGNESLVSAMASELGFFHWRFDRDRDKALAYYDEALAIARKRGDEQTLRVVLNNSGNTFRSPGGYPEAERRYAEGLAIAKANGVDDAFLLKNQGIVFRDTGRRAEGEALLLQALAVAERRGTARMQWQARMELGRLYADYDPPRAARYYEECLDVLEDQHNGVLLDGFRAGGLSGAITIYDDPYDLFIDFLLRTGQERHAFFVAERARARAFLDTLNTAREQLASVVSPEYVREERAVLDRISQSQTALRDRDLPAAERKALADSLVLDEERLTALRVRLAALHPALAHARFARPSSADAVQQQVVAPDETLIMYFAGAEQTTVWIVSRAGFEVRRLPGRNDLALPVRNFLDTVSTPQGEYERPAAALARVLLPDFEGLVPAGSRVIFIPHGLLHYVPFEALVLSDGRFLIERNAVSYAPSVSSLEFLRARRPAGREVLAIGNPVVRETVADRQRNASLERVGYLKPLPHSGREVRALAAIYGSATEVLEQQQATESALRAPAIARAGIVHIATHGLIDEESPDRSGLVLTAAPPHDDGILQVREIYRLTLAASLVTLSGCETALGKAVSGEGMVGLSRAFFAAGAGSVLASLWSVSDASTADLMDPFYRAVAAGRPLDFALQQAKLEFISGRALTRHPYFWAAFVVSGHATTPIPVRARGWPAFQLTAVLVATALALGAALWTGGWRRRRA